MLEFKQEPFLKRYIEHNTDLRYKKVIKNAILGKSIENPINEANVKIVTTRKQRFRPTFKKRKTILKSSNNY